MDPNDYLLTISEVAVGLAGFASIVLVIGQRSVKSAPIDRLRMGTLFNTSLGALFLALIALGLRTLPLSDDFVWRLSSGFMAAYVAISLSIRFPTVRRLMRTDELTRDLYGRRLNYIMLALAVVNLAAQCANAVIPAPASRFTVFFFGLVWFLFYAAFSLLRTIFSRPVDETGSTA